ncbi:hypothetical protein [Paenibacillus contaminans]|uniref:Heparinase n=1 Tax=Paenibacillus contaminans TaxID=450362 RepID=A0A329M3W7_9BACL|nr:hypothetical protein [Paenibacillus contaminans]RAV13343.1 hypothetical protein DQG23_33600 [Paenibacillus contaminans]
MFYDVPGQIERQRQIYAKLAAYSLDYFDEAGRWIGAEAPPRLRERLWYAISYVSGGNAEAIKTANRIIAASAFAACHFTPMAALQLLVKYKRYLDDQAIGALEAYLLDVLDSFRHTDLEFRGANDNFPTMGCYTLLAAGIYFSRPDDSALAVRRMHDLKDMLTRRGFMSEFNSPTYSPIQVYCMAEIAELVEEPTIRMLALQIEERLWADVWSHYHPSTYQTAGPYSRVYEVDSTAHTHQSRFILYALLGDKMAINPMNTLFSSKYGKTDELVHNNLPFMQVSVGWLLNTTFHCPDYLVEHGLHKTYPYRVQGTYELASSTDHPQPADPAVSDNIVELPAGSGSNSTYMTADYALGVIAREFRTGVFTDSFHLLYRRKEHVATQADVATVYANYIVNDKRPSEMNQYVGLNWLNWVDSILDEGRKIGMQHDRTAMLLYKPKLCLSEQVTSLKLTLLFPARYGFVEEVWLGERNLSGLEGGSVEPCPVFVKDGPVYMAFFPLLFGNHGRDKAVKVERINDYLAVSFYNYEGEARDFAKRGFLLTGNGFVAEVRSEAEVGSFDNFRHMFQDGKIVDEWAYGNAITSMRRTVYERDGLKMECIWSPLTEGVKMAAINGKIPKEPLLAITGLDTARLPFLEDEANGSAPRGSCSTAPR